MSNPLTPPHSSHSTPGFTLLETLLCVSMIGILAAIILPFSLSMMTRNDLDVAVDMITQDIHRAQTLARSGMNDSQWGVSVQQEAITLFNGVSFAARTTQFDETFSLSGTLQPSGVTEITFAKLTGKPNQTGSLTLTSAHNETRTITINAFGIAGY